LKYTEIFAEEILQESWEKGWISRRQHPQFPKLSILNYTNSCVHDNAWNSATTNCRGLIVGENDEIISRPFPKFWNIRDHSVEDLDHNFIAQTKLDGSLGIGYEVNGQLKIATRGRFASDQALWASEFAALKNWTPEPGITFLFEILYPENRIVVDYGNTEDVVFLCAIENESGETHFDIGWNGSTVDFVEGDLEFFRNPPSRENFEGYVLYFPGKNLRVKVKLEEYVRLHAIVTQWSHRRIWEVAASSRLRELGYDTKQITRSLGLDPKRHWEDVEDFISQLPDELLEKSKVLIKKMRKEASRRKADYGQTYVRLQSEVETRKDLFQKSGGDGVIMMLADGKDIEPTMWGRLKEEYKPRDFIHQTEGI
jgi:RNA ligase